MEREEVKKQLQTNEVIYAAFSRATQLPYVTCDEETFNDQVWIFSTEEEVKAFGQKKITEEKIPLLGVKIEKKMFPKFYGTLFAIGVNSIVYTCGESQLEIDLSDVARQVDLSKVPEEKRPLLNPSFQLSGIYFMQELRRPVKQEEKKNIKELEEELLANMKKAMYLVPLEVTEKEGEEKKINVPYVKTKDEKIFQPVFSDIVELEKFTKGKKMSHVKVPFNRLPKMLIPNAEGFVINPNGFNITLHKNRIQPANAVKPQGEAPVKPEEKSE